jgi:hypothetical protein
MVDCRHRRQRFRGDLEAGAAAHPLLWSPRFNQGGPIVKRSSWFAAVFCSLLGVGCAVEEEGEVAQSAQEARVRGLLPDLQTVVPTHLQVVRSRQRDILRFTNGIANTGQGPLQLVPRHSGSVTQGIQQLLDASGKVVDEFVASEYDFHAGHNHWHLADVARYEIRAGSPTGPVVAPNSIKVTFCLIDWYRLDDGNSGVNGATYWDCETGTQGISVGWVDQYHQSLDDQNLDLTSVAAGEYYLVSTANPEGLFVEASRTNNTAWVRFALTRDAQGRASVRTLETSPCATPGLCGAQATNR